MQRVIRNSLLIVLCGGMMFQSGCWSSVAAIAIQLGGSILVNNLLAALSGSQ
jgi:hypothetical protein